MSLRGSSSGPIPKSNQALFDEIKKAIQETTESTELVFEDISPEKGSLLVDLLSCQDADIERIRPRFSYNSYTRILNILVKPTEVPDGHQDWVHDQIISMLYAQFLNHDEALSLKIRVGTTLQNFRVPYANSRKEPDLFLRYNSQGLPSLVIESRWSESLPRLHPDMRLWLIGGQPEVQVVIILCWTKVTGNPTQQIRGIFEVWERNVMNVPFIRQQGTIFPVPSNAASQVIPITRAQLFGPGNVLPGRNPADVWNFSIDDLRIWGRKAIVKMGYVPA